MDSAKFEVRRGDRSLLIEGPSAFVSTTLEAWKSYISTQIDTALPAQAALAPNVPKSGERGATVISTVGQGSSAYENVYDSVDGRQKIICVVPGKTKAELTRNTALIVLFGCSLDGVELVPSEMLRQACIDQGCYDPTNFAQYLKGLKSSVVMNTKAGGGYDVKLTAPGRKEAKGLVEELNGKIS